MLEKLFNCKICPRNCGVDRRVEVGFCKTGILAKINIWQKHFGEEPVISGTKGSGTIFFSNCNLNCVYCQNYQISQYGWGKKYSINKIAEIMLELQKSEVHNINLITPTHNTLQIRKAINIAKNKGLNLPIVWNTSSYEYAETLKMMDGLVDIYLPDFKYFDHKSAYIYSGAENYPDIAKKAILEMHRQVGNLQIDENNLAIRGILIRLLLLPENINNIGKILEWIALNLGTETYLSLMSQYYPTYKVYKYPEINRSITQKEYDYAVNLLDKFGFEKGFLQELETTPEWTPNFEK